MSDSKRLSLKDELGDAKLSNEDAASFFIARQIVQEIRNFGANQATMLKVIELLALELEDRNKMLAIVGAAKLGYGTLGLSESSILEK